MADLNRLKKADLIRIIDDLRSIPTVTARVQACLPDLAELGPFDGARAAVALNLARQLDQMSLEPDGFVKNPPAPAPVAKELCSLLDDLEAVLGDDDDDSFFADLSASLGD